MFADDMGDELLADLLDQQYCWVERFLFLSEQGDSRWIGGGVRPMAGSSETLNRGRYMFSDPYKSRIVDSVRMIVDLSDSEKVIAHFPGGVSERWFDRWNKNFVDAWLSAEKRYWWFSDAAIAANTDTELLLKP
jgi:acyl-homoserine lactone acylase PvdQ